MLEFRPMAGNVIETLAKIQPLYENRILIDYLIDCHFYFYLNLNLNLVNTFNLSSLALKLSSVNIPKVYHITTFA